MNTIYETINEIEKIAEKIDILNGKILYDEELIKFFKLYGLWDEDDYSYNNISNVFKNFLESKYC